MDHHFSKVFVHQNVSYVLKAKFKLPRGWIGLIQGKYVDLPQTKTHVCPTFDDDEEMDKTCWTRNSVFSYLEQQIVNSESGSKFGELCFSNDLVNYSVTAKFKPDMIGWRGYITTGDKKKYISIPHNKSHVSPDFEDDDSVDDVCWTRKSVLRHLHAVAKENFSI